MSSALPAWTILAWVLLTVCYLYLPGPPPDPLHPNSPVNVNYVYGFDDKAPQTLMPPMAWLALLYVGLPLLVFLPTHLALRRWRGKRKPMFRTACRCCRGRDQR